MPALRNAGKNLARLREISAIVARHGFGQVFDRARIFEALRFRPRDEEAAPQEQKLSAAQRFRLTLAELGPTFVKLGQVLSSRVDLLPPDFIRELSLLQDRVPALPMEHVRQSIEQGLGRKLEECFSSIDPVPLASASIAQVHAARTLAGDDVVVKVQRPGIGENIRADLDLLYYVAQFLESVVEETGIYTPTGIVEEFEKSLLSELDFYNEAHNIEQFARNNAGRDYLVIPRVYTDLSCATILTMERLHGVKITELDPEKHDQKQVAHNLVEGVFQQLFVDGLFHADPHPGNVFVLEGNRLGLVDFGLVGRCTRQMQETILVLCLGIALKDPDTVARLLYKVGVPDKRVNLAAFRTDIAQILDTYLGVELKDVQSANLVNDMLTLAMNYGIKVPKEYAILTKAAITIEGVVRKIDPHMDVLAVAIPYAKRVLFERLSPKSASGTGLRALLQAQGFMQEVPLQLSQILMDLEGGKFVVNLRSNDLQKMVQAVRWLGFVVFAGLIASALIIGSFYVLASTTRWTFHGVPVLPVLGLLVAAGLFGGAFTWTVLSGRIHKVSVRRLLGKS